MQKYLRSYLLGCLLFFIALILAGPINSIISQNLFRNKITATIFDPMTLPADAKPASGYAWSDTVGWINFGDDTSATTGKVYVSNNELYGYAWGENVGWISMNCSNDTDCINNYNVHQTSANSGTLTGFAWGENIGWIDFAPAGGGVSITTNPSGPNTFRGYAWGENIGWISFSGTAEDASPYVAETDWTPPATCSDRVKNQDEVAIDCGGAICSSCGGGGGGSSNSSCTYDDPAWSDCINNTQSRTLNAINTPCSDETSIDENQVCISAIIATSTATTTATTTTATTSINISLIPATSTILTGESIQFTATVTGSTTNNLVNWTILPIETIVTNFYGTISDTGLYTAPNHAVDVTIQARSQADITKIATAGVNVKLATSTTPIKISLSPATSTMTIGEKLQLTATVTGTTTNNEVEWIILPIDLSNFYGTISTGGIYSAPNHAVNVTIIARAKADMTKTATSSIEVRLLSPCTSYTYTDWSICTSNTQTRNILASLPANCSGIIGAITTQTCTPATTTVLIISTTTVPSTSTTPGTTDPDDNTNTPTTNAVSKHTNNNEENSIISELTSALSVSTFVTENIAILGTTTEKIVLEVQRVIESPVGSVVTKTITTAGVVGGGIAATSIFAMNGTAIADLLFLPFKLWGLLLSALGLKKKNRPWGTVYDSVTKQPIDPAYVTLNRVRSKEESTSITDLDGRYGFLVSPGKYTITAHKTNYTFPSIKMAGKTEDIMYDNLYFGEQIDAHVAGAVISKNIPLDPIKFDWNEFVKGEKKLMKFYSKREKIVRITTNWIFRIGFIISIASLFLVTAPYNLMIFGMYIILSVLRKFGTKQKALGSLTEKNGDPLSYAIFRVFDAELNVEITNKVADKIGRYYCLVNKGRYYIKIERKNNDESYTLIYTSPAFNADEGIIHKDFII